MDGMVLTKTATLTVTLDDGVVELRLVRPGLLNRFDAELHRDFLEALVRVRTNPAVRAMVLASEGNVFSAGGDFDLMRAAHDDTAFRLAVLDEGRHLMMTLLDLPFPVVAAVQGDAIGLAATVVLGCDAVVMARSARLADPHVLIGLVAGDGGCVVWPQAVGILRAKRYLLTGDAVGAEDAHRFGLVTDLVETPAEVLPAARALAERIAALPPLAVQGTKRSLNRVLQQRAGEILELSLAYEGAAVASNDLLEAITAFKERRPGRYQGQ